MDLIILIPASLAVGLIVGVLAGLLGVGGGTIMVPAFRLVYNMSAITATATSLLTIVPTSVAGMITHIRNKTCYPAVGVTAGLGGACTSWIGVMAASNSPSWCVMAAAACVILYSASTMLKKALAMKPEGKKENKAAAPAPAVADDFQVTKNVLIKAALIGALAGVISGYVGVGGGFLMVPMFLSVLGLPMKKASGTSLVGIGILVLPALATQVMLGNVDWIPGLACIVGSMPGATLGAKLQQKMPERTLRFAFAGLLGVAAVLLVVKEMGLLG